MARVHPRFFDSHCLNQEWSVIRYLCPHPFKELRLGNGQDCCSTVFMPSAFFFGAMLDQAFTAGTIQVFFATSLVGGRHTVGQGQRCEEGVAVGEACFWRGALRGRSPRTREAACGRPPTDQK